MKQIPRSPRLWCWLQATCMVALTVQPHVHAEARTSSGRSLDSRGASRGEKRALLFALSALLLCSCGLQYPGPPLPGGSGKLYAEIQKEER